MKRKTDNGSDQLTNKIKESFYSHCGSKHYKKLLVTVAFPVLFGQFTGSASVPKRLLKQYINCLLALKKFVFYLQFNLKFAIDRKSAKSFWWISFTVKSVNFTLLRLKAAISITWKKTPQIQKEHVQTNISFRWTCEKLLAFDKWIKIKQNILLWTVMTSLGYLPIVTCN